MICQILEIDPATREATGTAAFYCSKECMDKAPFGANRGFELEKRYEDDGGGCCSGCVCETCSKPLD